MNGTSLTTTMAGSLGTADLAQLIDWGLQGFPATGTQAAAYTLAALLVIGAHGASKIVTSVLARKGALS